MRDCPYGFGGEQARYIAMPVAQPEGVCTDIVGMFPEGDCNIDIVGLFCPARPRQQTDRPKQTAD